MAKKHLYRTKNWKEYNDALVERGSLTLWVSEDALHGWLHRGEKRRGHPVVFSDAAILCALTLRVVFRLPLRQTEGFLRSLFRLLRVDLPVPDFSTLCLRGKTLRVPLIRRNPGPLHLLLDSTGLKIRGEGEWRQRQGKSGYRKWRKFHIGLDSESQEIVVQELSLSRVHDGTAGVRLIKDAPDELSSVTTDGSYDRVNVYHACEKREAVPVIPPRKDAKIRRWRKDPEDGRWKRHLPCMDPRDAAIRAIRRNGRKRWKRESGYHRRSLVETAFSRTQRLFGQGLRNKRMARQRTEAAIRCLALNAMTALGMPRTVRVA